MQLERYEILATVNPPNSGNKTVQICATHTASTVMEGSVVIGKYPNCVIYYDTNIVLKYEYQYI